MLARLLVGDPIRVASVPGAHPYVASLLAVGSPTARVLPDPPARDGATDRWWPPAMLTADWIERHADDFDVMHVHFGMESSTTREIAGVIAALHAADKPVVYTVHDLENPQLTDQAPHGEHLDLLIPAADALVTLTDGARREILRRWGRDARVIPHPNVAALAPTGLPAAGLAEGHDEHPHLDASVVHLRDLRPNIDGEGTVGSLAAAAELLHNVGPVEIVVDVNENVRDAEQLARIVEIVDGSASLRLVRHARYDDDDLVRSLSAATVAVLPYRHGTHSGWAELAWDLGVPIVTPRVGYIAEQHPESSFVFDPADATSLARAIAQAFAVATPPGSRARGGVVAARSERRTRERAEIAAQHETLYREVVR
jgi:glycosyltransferase involved in cell wall biosynthesis